MAGWCGDGQLDMSSGFDEVDADAEHPKLSLVRDGRSVRREVGKSGSREVGKSGKQIADVQQLSLIHI